MSDRIINRIYLLIAVVTAVFASSCSSDDAPDLSAGVAGNYEGYSSMTSGYFSNMISLDQKVTLTCLSDNTVSVSFASASTGTFTIPEATVVKSADSYTISGTGTTSMGHAGSTKDYDCSFTGTINGDSRVFVFSIPSVMGGTTVTFTAGELPESLYGYMLAGSYSGIFNAKSAYFEMADDAESTVTVEAAADGTVTIKCSSSTWGEISIPSVAVKRDGKTFSAQGTGVNNMAGMGGGATKEYACDGSISRNVDTEAVKVSFTMPAVMGGLTLSFDAD